MTRTKRISIEEDYLDWDSPKLSTLIDEGVSTKVVVKDPRFANPVTRRFIPTTVAKEHWDRSVSAALSNDRNPIAKLLRTYKATSLSEDVYLKKVKPLSTYWSLHPRYSDDCAVITGSGQAITEAFNVLGALAFLGQQTPPRSDELFKIPFVCSLKSVLQMYNSFGESDRVEGISRCTEVSTYYKILLIPEFDLADISPRVQQALYFLLQDREAASNLTIMHIADYDPKMSNDTKFLSYIQHRCKVV